MNALGTSSAGSPGTVTKDCGIADRILARAEKLDEQAREIVEAMAQKYHDKRIQDGVQDLRSKEILAREDWLKAEEAFCVALEEQIKRELEAATQAPRVGKRKG
jgi:hypothetical protein